jgi:hypothetical protein
MMIRPINTISVLIVAALLFSCSPKNISTRYYFENEQVLDRIEGTFKQLYSKSKFSIGFTDKAFNTVAIEFITDTMSYIYEFNVVEARMNDTIAKYHSDPRRFAGLISEMRSIKCAWIRNLDYYVDEKKNSLIFMSVRPVALKAPLSAQKYYVLTYYQQAQHFDSQGRLLDKRSRRRLRRINGEIFHRINDKVCYAISGNFR